MCHLFLARHAATAYTAEGIETGQLDVPLSDDGVRQAERVADRFATTSLAAIYSSTLARSRKTAEIIASHHGVSVKSKPALQERSYGDFEDEHVSVIRDHLRDHGTNWSEWNPPNGETRAEAVARARPIVEDLCEQQPDDRILIVAHSGLNKGLLASFISDDARYGHRVAQDLACVNELNYRSGGRWSVQTLNDTSHL
jgi:broad specificity phosphatase PhoE